MSYLVMETHPAYAVVMDEEGRFLKAANLRYQVGDTVQEIIELQMPRKKAIPLWKPLSGLAGLAACFCLVFFGYYRPNFTAYGTLRIQINPDVIALYAGTIAVECFGIVGMAAVSMKDGLVKLLKRESLTHGINVDIKENKISIDFHVIVSYGVSISAVSDNLIESVKYRVEEFTGMEVEKINIFVEGVRVID